MTGVTCPIEKCQRSRDGSSRRSGFTSISWKKSAVPKSVEDRGPPLWPLCARARRVTMSRRTKSARSRSSSRLSCNRGKEYLPWSRHQDWIDPNPRWHRAQACTAAPSGVHVPPVLGIRNGARLERVGDLLDSIADAPAGAESPQPLDLVERNPVGPRIARLGHDLDLDAGDARLELLPEIEELIVFEVVPHVQNRRAGWHRFGHPHLERPRDVAHVHEGAPLLAAEDRDLPAPDRVECEEVHDEVEPHAWREAVHGPEAEEHGLE